MLLPAKAAVNAQQNAERKKRASVPQTGKLEEAKTTIELTVTSDSVEEKPQAASSVPPSKVLHSLLPPDSLSLSLSLSP
jgi:hypothetical protein